MKPVYFILTLLPFALADRYSKRPRPTKTAPSTPTPSPCGTRIGWTCPAGQICVDNPKTCSMAVDCPGICIMPVFCGGIANIQCPQGQQCVDNPTDDCDPNAGGADCGGVCV